MMLIIVYILSVIVSLFAYKGFASTSLEAPPHAALSAFIPVYNLLLVIIGIFVPLVFCVNGKLSRWIKKGYK